MAFLNIFSAFFGLNTFSVFLIFFTMFSVFFPNIWPLAGPNIARKGWPPPKMARVDRQTHFGTFNFWVKPGFLGRARYFDYFLLFFGR